MPRTERKKSNTNTYHVLLRGINKQHVFEDPAGRTNRPLLSKCILIAVLVCLMISMASTKAYAVEYNTSMPADMDVDKIKAEIVFEKKGYIIQEFFHVIKMILITNLTNKYLQSLIPIILPV